jgi:class 3 adenylate cyclase
MITKSDFDNIDSRLKNITQQDVSIVENKSDFPPTLDELEDNNKTYSIIAAILFIDIRKSTSLTENSQAKSMVKIYRSFMRMTVDCVRKSGGVTRQFLGDRIMGVFMDTYYEDGSVKEKAVDKAVNAARAMQTLTDYSLNKHLKENVNGKIIECGIGIDYGKILVTKVGMYGAENNSDKENEVSFVWVGNATNHASKYSDLTDGGEIFISGSVYRVLSDDLKKDRWNKVAKSKGMKIYSGYVSSKFYLDFVNELGNAVLPEQNDSPDDKKQLADIIKAASDTYEKITSKEKSLAVQEEKLSRKKQDIQDYGLGVYYKLWNILKDAYLQEDIIKGNDIVYWQYVVQQIYELGKVLGKDEEDIRDCMAAYLVNIYDCLGIYSKSFEEMKYMAEHSSWVFLEEKTLEWAKRKNKIFDLSFELEWRIEHDSSEISISTFKEYLDEVRKYE